MILFVIQLTLKNGALCTIDSSREAVYGYDQRIEVFGTKGQIHAKNISEHNVHLSTKDGITQGKPLYSFVERYNPAYKLQLKAFFDYLLNDSEHKSPVDGYDTKKAVAIACAVNKSLKEHRPVKLTEIITE